MRKIRDVLRLRADGLSKREIAASLSIGVTTAGEIIRRVRRAGLSWPLPENLSDEAIERLVYADWTPERIRRQAGEIGRTGRAKYPAPSSL
jgi:transposase